MSAPAAFDLLGPLPTGTTLLEASAGTGKTYTIAALATRYIAQGTATIDQMLMITFGRSATRELRERVREALTKARDALRDNADVDDPVIGMLAALPRDEKVSAAERLASAVADFDAGSIATTHQFCSHALSGLGIRADVDPGEVFVENISDLVDQVVDDFYVRKYGIGTAAGTPISYQDAGDLARQAVRDPQAALDAGPVEPDSIHATRLAFAQAVRAEVLRRRRRDRLVTFDDLIIRLRDTLADPATGEQACRRLRDSYRVVLVDEFQDTDPAQWSILKTAFHRHRTLILIGDPKQAIYAFRGADIFSYLDAADHADHRATLPTNWRSDQAVVSGIEAVLGGMQLGDPRIAVHPVAAAHARSRLQGVDGQARVRLRTVPPPDDKPPPVHDQRVAVAADVATDIVVLLSGPGRLLGADGRIRPVAPGDIAVLVGTHAQAALVRSALATAHVPAVVTTSTSVFATDAARQWAQLLAAMQRPRTTMLRTAALTDFIGYTPEDLALRGDRIDDDVALRMRTWAQTLEQDSVAEMVARIEQETALASRVLAQPQGERQLTDLRHVAGALHAQQRLTKMGLAGLDDWLTSQIRRTAPSDREPTSELTRRLESDADAVQVLTVHVSKGLEFPVVYVPYGWDRYPAKPEGPLLCHDASGRRVLDVRGVGAPGREELLTARNTEAAGESLRLLYVALTRASSSVVMHWAATAKNTGCSPLHRLLSARKAGSTDPKHAYGVDQPPVIASPWVAVEPVTGVRPAQWQPTPVPLPPLDVAPYTRQMDTAWRRTSYSGLTASAHDLERGPGGFRDDEPDEIADEVSVPRDGQALASPFADLPAGAAFGTLVHGVLETVDTDADDLADEVATRCRERLAAFPVAGVTADALAGALMPALNTPLGPLACDLSLAEFRTGDRLAELDFELPMGTVGTARVADLADLLQQHLLSEDPLYDYPERLRIPALRDSTLVGYLSGSIDAVLRVPGPRFLVVDYKTNLLRDPARPGVEALVEGYQPPALARAMMDAHYPLQALLYSAAVHRFLRWRLPGYDPDIHLGGVMYLFVRGMAGPASGSSGVFSWQPPGALIVGLSDLLDGRRR